MGFLRSIFGASKDEIWGQVASRIGGEYCDGGFWGKDVLRLESGEWEIVLDTYTTTSSTGTNGSSSSTTYTRMRAPFVNKDNFHFKIYRHGFFSSIGKLFGMQDIEIGDSYFDDDYVIKGNDVATVKLLLNDARIKNLLNAVPAVSVEIRDNEGFFGTHFPRGTDMLYFSCVGVVKDQAVLKNLFDLFTAILQRLVEIDSAYESDPEVHLK